MTTATWELVQDHTTVTGVAIPAMFRLSVAGGWLVANSTSVAFVPDAAHAWTLDGAPVVVVPPVVTPPVVVVPTPQPGHSRSIGMNLSAVEDYAVQVPFNDMVAMSRDWISHPSSGGVWDDGRAVDVDANGYVRSLLTGQQPGTLISFTNGPHARPAGTYALTWDGVGTVVLSGTTITRTESNRITFTYNPVTDQSMEIRVTAVPDTTNYPRNMHAFQSGVTSRWDSRFLSLFGNFNTVRFMDWSRTNNSTLSNWADRSTLSSRSQSGVKGGVSLEAQIDLCNQTGTNGWFNIPHLATDDYVKQMATLLKAQMAPGLKVYLEFSNECWNGQFQQATWCRTQGLAAGISTDPWLAQISYYSRRARQCMDIAKAVFGTDTRLVRVMAGQGVNIGVTPQVLGFEHAASSCDAYAVADYFGYEIGSGTPVQVAAFLALSPTAQLDVIAASSAAQTTFWTQQVTTLKAFGGIPLVAYEGGPHLVGSGDAQSNTMLETAFETAAANPRMGMIITAHLAAWKAAGGGLFCYFNSISAPSKFGNWGALLDQSLAHATTPKWTALQAAVHADAT